MFNFLLKKLNKIVLDQINISKRTIYKRKRYYLDFTIFYKKLFSSLLISMIFNKPSSFEDDNRICSIE